MDLTTKKCVPCEGGMDPFDQKLIEIYIKELDNNWTVVENQRISNDFRFKDYKQTMSFVNQVAEVAEAENHHPVMHVSYGKVTVELWTHSIGGLSENDFILAAKIDKLPQ